MEQMLLAAMTLPQLPNEPETHFVQRIIQDSKETAKRAAERGTRIHESIEKYFLGGHAVEHEDMAKAFDEKVTKHFKLKSLTPWIVESSFTDPMGFGGKVDLYTGIDATSPTGIVSDAKSKDFDYDDDVVGYPEHAMQLAAYRYGLGLPEARCANVFVSVKRPGLIKVHEWTEKELDQHWEMFKCLLRYWTLKNKFGE